MSRDREIYEELADQLVALREDIRWRRENRGNKKAPPPPSQAILGGIVKAFKFYYDPETDSGKTTFNGTFWFDLGVAKGLEHQATFILRDQRNKEICYNIVDKTSKLDHEAVLEVYFAAYSEKLGKWVLACERFDTYLEDKIANERAQVADFFTNPLQLELQDFWRRTVRNLISVLALSRKKGVVLGNLSAKDGYVIVPSGEIKVFGIGTPAGKSYEQDLADLRKLFWSGPFFRASASEEWQGFDFLLGSILMKEPPTVWEPVVLNHPTLLSSSVDTADNHAQLTCYHEIERFMWNDIDGSNRTAFINALYYMMPKYRMVTSIQNFPRQNISFTQEQESVYKAAYAKSNSDSRIYVAVIIAARNLVRHGYECSKAIQPPGWNKTRIAREIKLLFGGFMSNAYTVSKLPVSEWKAMAAKIHSRQGCLYY